MDTPLAKDATQIQNRNGKRHRLDVTSPQFDDHLRRAMDLIADDRSLPPHLKAAIGYLFEMKSELDDVLARNKQLMDENRLVKGRNSELEAEIVSLKSQITILKQSLSDKSCNDGRVIPPDMSYEDIERKRSVVVAGIQECVSPIASVRVSYDLNCIRRINDFLSVDCQPTSVYRMGRYVPGKPRLLKVVFPSSFFSSLLLRRAPKLRFFSEKGIFVRRSLSLAERQSLRAHRNTRDADIPPNIRSIVKNSDALALLIKQHCPDIIAITETWLNPNITLSSLIHMNMSPYTVLRCDRPSKRGGGVVLIVRNLFSPMTIFSESVVNAYEILCCDLSVSLSMLRIILIYRTPSCTAAMSGQLTKAVSDLVSCRHCSIVIGDLNFPCIAWNGSVQAQPTQISASARTFLGDQYVTTGTLNENILDLVLSNEENLITGLEVLPPVGSSDHAAISFTIDAHKSEENVTMKRDFSMANYQEIERHLTNVDWFGSLNCVDTVDAKYELFLGILSHTIELFVPVTKKTSSRSPLPNYLSSLTRKRERAWIKAQKSNTFQDQLDFERLSKKL
ncbi:endonuclease/exonuclease/phosphatase family protein, partial [Cooperia oncophora]